MNIERSDEKQSNSQNIIVKIKKKVCNFEPQLFFFLLANFLWGFAVHWQNDNE